MVHYPAMRKFSFPLSAGFWCRPIIRYARVSNLAALTFKSKGYLNFTKRHMSAILHMKGMTIMSEMRTLFDALLIVSVLTATGTVLAIIFR